jgi:hypothetical protein
MATHIPKLFIIGGNLNQYKEWTRNHRDNTNGQYTYHHVTSPEIMRGCRDIHGVFLPGWMQLESIDEILSLIYFTTESQTTKEKILEVRNILFEHRQGRKPLKGEVYYNPNNKTSSVYDGKNWSIDPINTIEPTTPTIKSYYNPITNQYEFTVTNGNTQQTMSVSPLELLQTKLDPKEYIKQMLAAKFNINQYTWED